MPNTTCPTPSFKDTRRAVLCQNTQRVLEIDLHKRGDLAHLLTRYFLHSPAEVEKYHQATAVFEDRIPMLGNRSALEWVRNQYQVSTDKRSGLVTDPNRADDQEYIARLVRRVVTASMEAVRIVAALPPVEIGAGEGE